MSDYTLHVGDCYSILQGIGDESIDLVYVDPPFFTQKVHSLKTRDGVRTYSFSDLWKSAEQYGDFLLPRLKECYRCLRSTGSIFFHCDDNSAYIARLLLDAIFGAENFQSEIIWSYRRWSNSKKGLMPSHQTILFYTKSTKFKFKAFHTAYSESTNIDQILQRRVRDVRGKAIYERDDEGEPISNGAKKGVPLGDVWEIPFLNPKAKERVGYPTQKPVLLLERIIELCTDQRDMVLDPFCGSGTTLVAATLLNRKSIGIDISDEAIALTQGRLNKPHKTESRLMELGRGNYAKNDLHVLEHLKGVACYPVHRNKGIDAILVQEVQGRPVCVRIQRDHETVEQAANALIQAAKGKGGAKLILVAVDDTRFGLFGPEAAPEGVTVVRSAGAAINEVIDAWTASSPNERVDLPLFQIGPV
ncbi:MAG: DNA methyltransferase [Bryobacter sp.]|nr:DNA methyltransferase [Bryobacter sp.]